MAGRGVVGKVLRHIAYFLIALGVVLWLCAIPIVALLMGGGL